MKNNITSSVTTSFSSKILLFPLTQFSKKSPHSIIFDQMPPTHLPELVFRFITFLDIFCSHEGTDLVTLHCRCFCRLPVSKSRSRSAAVAVLAISASIFCNIDTLGRVRLVVDFDLSIWLFDWSKVRRNGLRNFISQSI